MIEVAQEKGIQGLLRVLYPQLEGRQWTPLVLARKMEHGMMLETYKVNAQQVQEVERLEFELD